ncbi:hypothetical protein SKAU_G00419960 [Synaphobranchus kaupii]|uniref:Uncharacterized protein n=1 Tax=Synaphobranchus kaupii TaxID=118154 RepID=A0A9Q1E6M3_SYNKA|nr:hypothetical protein SKAU_G00419960 [Synaphobranchus kaupii]
MVPHNQAVNSLVTHKDLPIQLPKESKVLSLPSHYHNQEALRPCSTRDAHPGSTVCGTWACMAAEVWRRQAGRRLGFHGD